MGDFVATAAYTLNPRGPQWLDPGVFGDLPWGLAAGSFGAAAVYPGKEIWLIGGDGPRPIHWLKLIPLFRKGFSVIAVIGNDARWNGDCKGSGFNY